MSPAVTGTNSCADVAGAVCDLCSRAEPRRVVRVRPGEIRHRAVERRREQHRLPILRNPLEDAVDLGPETHVQHPVGLVEDEDANRSERDETLLEKILEPARSSDEDLGPPSLLRLTADGGATVDGGDPQVAGCGEWLQVGDDLGGKLARRDEHERARMPAGTGRPHDHREAEGERLAGARRGCGEDVHAGESVAQDEVLDRKR